jgi:hypothetical protein
MLHADYPAWLADVTSEDLAAVGMEQGAGEQPAPAALADWAEAYEVDLRRVDACLQFLRSGPHLLLAPAPLALLAYSPRRDAFCASFDLATAPETDAASTARAGAWLTVLSAEVGELPTDADHWLTATVLPGGLSGKNLGLLSTVQAYATSLQTSHAAAQRLRPPGCPRRLAHCGLRPALTGVPAFHIETAARHKTSGADAYLLAAACGPWPTTAHASPRHCRHAMSAPTVMAAPSPRRLERLGLTSFRRPT